MGPESVYTIFGEKKISSPGQVTNPSNIVLYSEYESSRNPQSSSTSYFFVIPSIPLCYDDYFINKIVKQNNLLTPIMGCLYVNFVGLHVSVIHVTIIRSVRAKEIAMQQRFPERNGIPLCYVSILWGYVLSKTLLIEEYVSVAF